MTSARCQGRGGSIICLHKSNSMCVTQMAVISFHFGVFVAIYPETFFWLVMQSSPPRRTSAREARVNANFLVLWFTVASWSLPRSLFPTYCLLMSSGFRLVDVVERCEVRTKAIWFQELGSKKISRKIRKGKNLTRNRPFSRSLRSLLLRAGSFHPLSLPFGRLPHLFYNRGQNSLGHFKKPNSHHKVYWLTYPY